MLPKGKNSWKTLHETIKFETPWIQVSEHQVLNPAGKPGIYGKVSFKNLAIGVVPIDNEGFTWLVGQWRYPLNQYSWEIPEGGGPHGIDPLTSAKRELKEETGLIAANYSELCRMHTSNSVSDELAIIYLATDLKQEAAEPEESEDLMIKRVKLEDAIDMVMQGEITDSLSMVALLKIKILKEQQKL
jgi:8-oxo-dGTP pyrophosphatase MutT (NUDIX family)